MGMQNTETHVHKITYGPLIVRHLYIMLLVRANPLLGQLGGIGPWKSRLLWSLNGTPLTAQCHCTGLKKVLISMAQPTPTGPLSGFARIKSIAYGAV
jgi:hypothetical protein